MSKVICDVCGTTYPETATQCPICGSAKNSATQTVAGGETKEGGEGYSHVPGGRFSKKNVRKMSNGGTVAQRRTGSSRNVQDSKEPNNTGLIIVIVLLVLAIFATLAYIVVTRFVTDDTEQTDPPKQSDPADQQTDPSESEILCTDLQLSNDVLELNVGESWSLKTQLTPAETTETVHFETSDKNVAVVSDTGEIMMVGEGEAIITVTCGNQSATCTVKSPQEVTQPILPPFTLELNTKWIDADGVGDVTLSSQGETWRFYKTGSLSVPVEDILWTSDDPSVATIQLGIVTAVGHGTTKVHATYNGTTYSALIRCPFEVQENGCTVYMSEGGVMKAKNDVTISVGEAVTVALRDVENATVEVTWSCDDGGVTIDGNTIVGATPGNHTLYCEYEGVTYKCTIRVKQPATEE